MSEPLVLVNLFSMPAEMVDGFVGGWEASVAAAKNAPGFRGTRLHRSLDPGATYPVVNIARWDSVEDWRAAFDQYFSGPSRREDSRAGNSGRGAVSAHPTLYSVVHVTPDPTVTGAQS